SSLYAPRRLLSAARVFTLALVMFSCCVRSASLFFFFFSHTAPTEFYTLSLHDALPISAPPLMPTATTTGRSRAVGRLRIRRSHRIAIMSSPAATLRNGILLPPASTSRRWWARILDAFFVLVFTGFIIGLAFALYGADAI